MLSRYSPERASSKRLSSVRRIGWRTSIPKVFERLADSGNTLRCAFCPDCGTRLHHALSDETEIYSLKGGSLDDLSGLSPVGHIWVRSKQPWVDLTALPGDLVFETYGVKVIVDRDSADIVDGTEIDFVKDGLNETFQFNNPNSKDACGCGESFHVSSSRRRE